MSKIVVFFKTIFEYSKSLRFTLFAVSMLFLLGVFSGQFTSPVNVWTVEGEHLRTEQYIIDLATAVVVCLLVQSVIWVDTVRPFNRKKKNEDEDKEQPKGSKLPEDDNEKIKRILRAGRVYK